MKFVLIIILSIFIGNGLQMYSKTPSIDGKNIDKAVTPGQDFFQYANGEWLKSNPIPPEYSIYGSFTKLQEDNLDNLKIVLEEASKVANPKKGSVEQQIGDFYRAGMDEKRIESMGPSVLSVEISKTLGIRKPRDIAKQVAYMHSMGIFPLFYVYSGQDEMNSKMVISNLMQGGLGLRDRDYYLSDDKRSAELRKEYLIHMKKMFMYFGHNDKEAGDFADMVMKFETQLANASKTRVDLRDPKSNYNKMTIDQLNKSNPGFFWKEYFQHLGIKYNEVNVGQPEFFAEIDKLVENTDLKSWKIYLMWTLIRSTANYLNSQIVDENFRFYGTVFSGQEKLKERWKRVLESLSGDLGEALGQLYVKKFFPAESKKRMVKLVENVKKSLGERIKNLKWMGEKTKKEALAKLNKINVKIGYPDKWIDYSSISIDNKNYLLNSLNAGKFAMAREFAKIGKAPDPMEWGMTPQTVNAYYSPNMNEIVFPAAILQPPFFWSDADDAVNYAAIGTVIGHELTHGFDDQGRQYDKDGNLKDWWTEEDGKKFDEYVKVLEEQYNGFVAIDTNKLNGKLTLGENIADLGGITVSFDAWKMSLNGVIPSAKIDGFTPMERFFLSYAQIWRNNIRDKELMRRLKEDVHSPGRFRVNGVLPNVPEFYKTFNIQPGDKMYLPEKDRAKIW